MYEGRDVLLDERELAEFLAQKVLDGLDVMVGRRLERLDPACILGAEPIDDCVQGLVDFRLKRLEFADASFRGEMLEPADLDEGAVADQSIFGQVIAQ